MRVRGQVVDCHFQSNTINYARKSSDTHTRVANSRTNFLIRVSDVHDV